MNEYDVVVAGAGPGGATVAASLAASGYQVALLERGRHPVPHLPETWFPRDAALLDALGVDGIEKAFLDQAEVHFYNASGDFGLRLRLECVSHEGDRPVRLNRSIFDEILVRHATACGAEYAAEHTVTQVDMTSESAPVLECQTPTGPRLVRGRLLVDASGKSGLVANRLGLKTRVEKLDPRVAVFSHFMGRRWNDVLPENAMAVIGLEEGYLFVIPLTGDRISVGIVVPEALAQAHEGKMQDLFTAQLQKSSLAGKILSDATRVLPVIPALNHSYVCDQVAGPGYCIVGEAGAFLDPFFSNGVTIALKTGLLAASAIQEVLATPSPERQRTVQDAYNGAFRQLILTEKSRAYERFQQPDYRQFLMACADPHLPMFLPLALLMPSYARAANRGGELPDLQRMLRSARDAFIDPRGAA